MIRRLGRHIVDSLKGLKRNGWMTIAAVTAVTITLSLLVVLMTMIFNVQRFSKDVQDNVTVYAYVAVEAKQKDIQKTKETLEKIPDVAEVHYSSKEDEYEKLIKNNKDFKGITDKDSLYSAFEIKATNPNAINNIVKEAKTAPSIVQVTAGGKNVINLVNKAQKVKIYGSIASIILIIISILLVSNTIKLTILARSEDIKIMRLVGATNGYIRWPFFFEGAWIGILGSIIPILLILIGYRSLYNDYATRLLSANYHMLSTGFILQTVGLGVVVLGILIGAIGSLLSMRRFLKY